MKYAGSILAVSTILAVLAVPAPSSAQFSPRDDGFQQRQSVDRGPSGRRFQDDDDDDVPRRRRSREFQDQDGRFGERGRDEFRRGEGQSFGRQGNTGGRQLGAGSSICATSRGTCDAGFRAAHNTPCRCNLPGFGEKHGAIQ